MKKSGLILFIMLFSFSALAEQFLVNDFHRRFKVHKNSEDNAVMILDRVYRSSIALLSCQCPTEWKQILKWTLKFCCITTNDH